MTDAMKSNRNNDEFKTNFERMMSNPDLQMVEDQRTLLALGELAAKRQTKEIFRLTGRQFHGSSANLGSAYLMRNWLWAHREDVHAAKSLEALLDYDLYQKLDVGWMRTSLTVGVMAALVEVRDYVVTEDVFPDPPGGGFNGHLTTQRLTAQILVPTNGAQIHVVVRDPWFGPRQHGPPPLVMTEAVYG